MFYQEATDVLVDFVFSSNAKLMWDELAETYDKIDGEYDTMVQLHVCTCEGSSSYNDHAQLLKLMKFVMGLDDVYAPIRCTLLTTEPLPIVNESFSLSSGGLPHTFTSDQYQRLMSLLSDSDVSHLDISVAHPNGTKAKVNQIRSCKLNDNLVIHDVLVVPEYQVGTDSEKYGLYFFKSRRTLWHNRLGHPTDQVLSVLKNDIDLKRDFSSEPCDVLVDRVLIKKSYKLYSLDSKQVLFARDVKFYETVYPFKNNSLTKEYLIESNGINNLNFFDVQRSNDPNDDVRVNSEGGGTNPSSVEPAVESDDADQCPNTEPSASTSNESFDKSGSKSSYDVNFEMPW
ncbi:hypothetical protein Tco_0838667 [Tanacetum coccineum]|uniref:GAG-pre-integrase domain-containing protein n=1 Tax=Tanacetum coccineum TaxID=301880 RepID=A0ABQ5ANF8_9ASTR